MRIELDFDKKEITLKDNISISEVIEKMELLKIDDWKEWKIKAQETIWQYYPYYPWTNPYPLGTPYVSTPYVWTEQTTSNPYTITCSQ